MTPLEEAAALTKLVHKGVTLDDVVAQTGLSATTIKRRLALKGLCKEAKAALRLSMDCADQTGGSARSAPRQSSSEKERGREQILILRGVTHATLVGRMK
jgi:hypothetical protein